MSKKSWKLINIYLNQFSFYFCFISMLDIFLSLEKILFLYKRIIIYYHIIYHCFSFHFIYFSLFILDTIFNWKYLGKNLIINMKNRKYETCSISLCTIYYLNINEIIKALLSIFWKDEKTKLVVINIYINSSFLINPYNQYYKQMKKLHKWSYFL